MYKVLYVIVAIWLFLFYSYASNIGSSTFLFSTLLCNLNNSGVILQAGAMQIMFGGVEAKTNVSGVGDFFKKALSSSVTGESAIKPKYSGNGQILLEPTYKHILIEDLKD